MHKPIEIINIVDTLLSLLEYVEMFASILHLCYSSCEVSELKTLQINDERGKKDSEEENVYAALLMEIDTILLFMCQT